MLTAAELLPAVGRRALARLVTSRGRLLVIGVGGSGKSELLAAAAADLAERGLDVRRVEGRAAGAEPGLVLEDLLTSRDALTSRNLALVVDDAHRLDAAAATALARLWALAPARRLPVLVARRPGPRPPGLGQLDEASSEEERLWLVPLGAAEVADRVAARTGEVLDPHESGALGRFTAGSPRLVDRLVGASPWSGPRPWADHGVSNGVGVGVGVGVGNVADAPPALVDEVVGAIEALGAEAALAARLVAVAGDDPVLVDTLLERLAGGSTLLDVLGRAGLAGGSPPRLVPAVALALRAVTPPAAIRPVVEALLREPGPGGRGAGPGGEGRGAATAWPGGRAGPGGHAEDPGGEGPGAGDQGRGGHTEGQSGEGPGGHTEGQGGEGPGGHTEGQGGEGPGGHAEAELRARLHQLAGDHGPTVAAAYLAAAQAALGERPTDALRWAGLAAGAPGGWTAGTLPAAPLAPPTAAALVPAPSAGAPIRAEALWLQARAAFELGDVDLALRAAEAAGTPRALALVAALLPRLGRWQESAAIYERLGPQAAPFAELAQLRARGSGFALTSTSAGDGGLSAGAVATTAAALAASLAAPPPGPRPDLLRALGGAADVVERVAPPLPLPDTPHALAAVLASMAGEHQTATAVLDRALERGAGGGHLQVRHRVLRAWVLLQGGRLASAAHELDELGRQALAPAEAVALRAVEAGVARRAGSTAHLQEIWRHAAPLVRLHPPDVLDVAALGELAIVAAKLGEGVVAERWLDEARALATNGSSPWRAWSAWVAFQVALAAGEDARAAADQLAAEAEGQAGLSALGAAAPVWAAAARGQVDGPAVLAAVEGLRLAGFRWEARQLASHAALHTAGGELARALLDAARRLHAQLEWSAPASALSSAVPAASEYEPAGEAAVTRASVAITGSPSRATTGAPGPLGPGFELTEREEEVVRLLLAGHSYKEVAALLFISPKTVERHVTNTRAKVGADTRAEFFSAVRRYFADRQAPR